MERQIKYLMSLLLLLCSCFSFAQQTKIDSLLTLLKKDKEDTNKVNHFIAFSMEFMNSNPDTAIILSNQALNIINSLPKEDFISQSLTVSSYINLCIFYRVKGDYPKALDYVYKALSICEGLERNSKFKSKILPLKSKTLGNIGLVYWNQGNISKSIDFQSKALKIDEEIGNKTGSATWTGNLGNAYAAQGDYLKSLGFQFKALKMEEEMGNISNMVVWMGNIGYIYQYLATQSKIKNKKDSLFKMAEDYDFRALKMSKECGDKRSHAIHLGNIGELYSETEKYAEAEKYFLDAIKMCKEVGARYDERQFEESISTLYRKTKRFEMALEHYQRAMILKDSLFSEEKDKEITRKELNYEFEKKEAAAKSEQDKKDAVAVADAKRQKIVLLLVSFVLLLVAVVAFIIFRSLRLTRKQKTIIEEQKELVEEKQKEIIDSIYYARRIQRSLLTSEKYIDKNLSRLMRRN